MYPQHNDHKTKFLLRLRDLIRAFASRFPESYNISQKRKSQQKDNNVQLHQNISSLELRISIAEDLLTVATYLARNLRSLEFGSPSRIVTMDIHEERKDAVPTKCSYQASIGGIRQTRYTDQVARVRSSRRINTTPSFTEKNTNSAKHYHRRKGSNLIRLIYTFILLLTIFVLPAKAKYTVYNPKPGLYVEHIGTGKVSRGTFRLDVPFSYAKLEEDVNSINHAVQQMYQLCENMKSHPGEKSCDYLLFHLTQLEKQADRMKESLYSYTSRQQRGLGKFLTSLFGANEDAYRDISQFDTKQQELGGTSLYQAKALLTDATEFNEDDTNIKLRLRNFLNRFTDAINSKTDTSKINQENALYMQIFTSYQAATNYINEIINYYTPLLNIQMNRGSLYDLFSPDTIDKSIASFSKNFPSDLQILSQPILDTKISRDQDTIYIHGYFPIIDNRNFTLLKVIPVPLQIEGNFYWFLDTPSDVIAVDYDAQLYFYQSDEELHNAIQIEDNKYLCAPKTIKKMEEDPSCVIDNIYAQTANNTCEIEKDDITSIIWKELYTENAWMFITNKATTVSVVCDGNRDDVSINNSGILEIPQNCYIQTRRNVLTPKQENVIHVLSAYSKHIPVNMRKTVTMQTQNSLGRIAEPVIEVFDTFKTIQERVEDVQEQIEGVKYVKRQGVVTNVVTGASVVSVILAVLVTYRAAETFWKKLIPHSCAGSSQPDESSRLIQPTDGGE